MKEIVKSPCLGCAERTLGCHSQCKKFNAYKQKVEEVKQAERVEKAHWAYVGRSIARREAWEWRHKEQ